MIKIKSPHFYWNKYFVSPFSNQKYFISYDFKRKIIWYRVFKVATRSINDRLGSNGKNPNYLYSSEVGYIPSMYKDYFKFAFVRNPEERFISAWKDKVLRQNYFDFDPKQHDEMKILENFVNHVYKMDIWKCDEHLRCQCSLIDIENADFIGRFENFENDFSKVAEKVNLDKYVINHLNSTKPKPIDITIDIRKKIYKIYKQDFDQFYPAEGKEINTL